jgi:hypothetical protein
MHAFNEMVFGEQGDEGAAIYKIRMIQTQKKMETSFFIDFLSQF